MTVGRRGATSRPGRCGRVHPVCAPSPRCARGRARRSASRASVCVAEGVGFEPTRQSSSSAGDALDPPDAWDGDSQCLTSDHVERRHVWARCGHGRAERTTTTAPRLRTVVGGRSVVRCVRSRTAGGAAAQDDRASRAPMMSTFAPVGRQKRPGVTLTPPRRSQGAAASRSASTSRARSVVAQLTGQSHGCSLTAHPSPAHRRSAARSRGRRSTARRCPGWRLDHRRQLVEHQTRVRPCRRIGGRIAWQHAQAGKTVRCRAVGEDGSGPPDPSTA